MEIHVAITSVLRVILLSRNKNSSDRYLHKNCCTFEAHNRQLQFSASSLSIGLQPTRRPIKEYSNESLEPFKEHDSFPIIDLQHCVIVSKRRLPLQIQILHSKLLLYSSTENSVKKDKQNKSGLILSDRFRSVYRIFA